MLVMYLEIRPLAALYPPPLPHTKMCFIELQFKWSPGAVRMLMPTAFAPLSIELV